MLYLLSISGVQESDGLPDGSFQQCYEVTNLPETAGLDNPLGKWMPPSVSPSSAPAALGRAVYIGPITYKGQAAVQRDIENFRAALAGVHVEEAFLPAAPTMVQYGSRNEYYPSDEAYVYALADALQEEYNAMVNAGFLFQIDAPELPATYDRMLASNLTLQDYRDYATLCVYDLKSSTTPLFHRNSYENRPRKTATITDHQRR